MQLHQIMSLYDYNYWANACILSKSAELDPEFWIAPAEVSFRSLRGTMAHVLSTEWTWRQRVQEDVSPSRLLPEDEFPTVEAIRTFWEEEERSMREFLSELVSEDLDKVIHYQSTKGLPFENPLWEILMQVVIHGTQFRSEAGVLLTQYGRSPGDMDYILFLRQKHK